MVKIRLSRAGAKNRPFYRIVAIDERSKRNGRALEFLGTYDATSVPEKIAIRSEALEAWLQKGARLSPTVASLVRRTRRQPAAGGAA